MQNALNAIFSGRKSGAQSGLPPRGAEGAGHARPIMPREGLFYDEQMQLFQKRTADFLRRSFPSFSKTLTEAEQEKLAVNVQKRAGLRGFITEKEIWHYLIAAVYCGFFFEQDPQYADMLRLIGWHETDADRALLLDRLLNIIDEYSLECEKDFTDFGRKMSYLAEFYADPRFSRKVIEALPAPEQRGLAAQMLDAVFPARAALWTEEARQRMIVAGLDQAQRLGFCVKEGLLYCIASVYFGRGFEQSPLYPWAYFLHNRNISAPDRINQFITAIAKHFKLLGE